MFNLEGVSSNELVVDCNYLWNRSLFVYDNLINLIIDRI